MANVIKPKRTTTASLAPTTSDIADGEIAINMVDRVIYQRNGSTITPVASLNSIPRVGTTTSSATPSINTDLYDQYILSAQAVDITSFTTNLTGTPKNGQKLWIAIVGTAARAIAWGTSFEASTVALPTTTVTTNRLDVGFVYNSATSKWRCVGAV